MAIVFISHSRRDGEMIKNVKTLLENIGHKTIIEEFIPEEKKLPAPYEEIRSKIQDSDLVFLFLTDNVVSTEYTKNWVLFEVGLASASRKRLYVFERQGEPILYPIPYLTDYNLFSPHNVEDILELQRIVKETTEGGKDLIAAGVGAAVGTVLGPIGTVGGAILGYLFGPKPKPVRKVRCDNCNISFNYYSEDIPKFKCPACRTEILL